MRFNLTTLLLIILIGLGLCWVTAPWFAFRSLRDAARTNDVAALTQLVDYGPVRTSLADQLSGRPMAQTPAPNVWQDPIGALKNAFTPTAPAPPEVETYVSAKGLAALTMGRPASAGVPATAKTPFPVIEFWGPSRCRIAVKDPATPGRKTEFTFQRKGIMTWKLTRIVLPRTPAANR